MKKSHYLQTLILVAVLLLSAVSLLVLPDNVAVQWNSDGASNYISKAYAVLIPAVISLFGIVSWRYSSVRYNTNIETSKKFQTIHSVIWGTVSCIGIIISISFMIINQRPVIL